MAAQPGDKIWIRGEALNTTTLPNRARTLLGENWESEKTRVTVIDVKRGGVLHVQLSNGEEAFVKPQWVTEEFSDDEEEQEVAVGGRGPDTDLGSDEEREEIEPQAEGDEEGSESRRFVHEVDSDWQEKHITQDERKRAGYRDPRRGGYEGTRFVLSQRHLPLLLRLHADS